MIIPTPAVLPCLSHQYSTLAWLAHLHGVAWTPLHELTPSMLSAPIIANGTDSAFHVLAAKPANTALAPVAMPVRETNPWAHAPDAANKEIAAIRPGKVATDIEVDSGSRF